MIAVLLNVLLPIATTALIGALLRRFVQLDLATLNRLMLYGLSPALIFVSLAGAEIAGATAARMMGLAVLLVAALALVTVPLTRLLRLPRADSSALLLAALFMNSGNYGLPAARFAFGEAGFEQALLYFVAQSILAQTLGVMVAAAGGSRGRLGWPLLQQVIGRLFRMPQIYAVLAALAVRASGVELATLQGFAGGLWRGAELTAEAALPVMLMILGMQLADGVPHEDARLLALGVGLRLVVSPILALGLGLALGLSGVALSVGVLLAGMPTAVNTSITAIEFQTRPSLVVAAVAVTSLLSLLTLTIILSLLGGG